MKLLPVSIVADRLGCSVANVYRLIHCDELPSIRVGLRKGYMIDEADLEAFERRRAGGRIGGDGPAD